MAPPLLMPLYDFHRAELFHVSRQESRPTYLLAKHAFDNVESLAKSMKTPTNQFHMKKNNVPTGINLYIYIYISKDLM